MKAFRAFKFTVLAVALSWRSALALDAPTDLELKAGYCMGSDLAHMVDLDKLSSNADGTAKSKADFQSRIDRLRDYIKAKGFAPPGERDSTAIGIAEQRGQDDARQCFADLHTKLTGCVTKCLKTTDTKEKREACIIECYDTEACKTIKTCASFETQLP